MRDPGAVVSGPHFAELILPHFIERLLIGHRIVLDRHLRRHASHGVDSAAMAGLDQQIDIGLEEMPLHRDQRAIRQHELGEIPELLDEAENVIPAAAVQSRRVIAKLIEDLVHLERGQNRFDQHRRADRAARNTAARLARN